MKPKRIVLASASPRRRETLEKFGVRFDIIPSDADENIDKNMPCGEYVCALASKKGEAVRQLLVSRGEDVSDTLIISCDTVVYYRGMIIGKPDNDTVAEMTLGLLSDSYHTVYSGLSLIYGDTSMCDVALTEVKFAEISEKDIAKYVKSGEPRGKAGSYAIQGDAAAFVEKIDGDYYNVVGFPLALFCRMIKTMFGISIFELGEKK
ncbi:MAG: septum formation protein Maf [Clostridia bacterium]|nr:septum formation protein Maf [Clostridia bacterium]MBO4428627.1 septum formation protein Maf [Clostridia bacterium]